MKRLLAVSKILILSTLISPAFGASYYILYDVTCVNRLEYAYPETRAGNEFISYSVKAGADQQLVLEIGMDHQSVVQNTLPPNTITCQSTNTTLLNAALVDAVNNKVHQLYVVYPLNTGQYRVSLVKQAFVFISSETQLSAASTGFRLTYFKDGQSTSGDLSGNDTRGSVFFLNETDLEGGKVLVFRQTHHTADDYLDIFIHPEIGILEERSRSGNASFTLKTVNGVSLSTYFSQPKPGEAGLLTAKSGTLDAVPNAYDMPAVAPASTIAIRTHAVIKGESLYSISRKYGITIPELQAWNNLGNNTTIHPGQTLSIDPSSSAKVNAQSETFAARGVAAVQVSTPAWINAPSVITVSAGETVASLALKYGYTEARFRYFNNLGPNAVLMPGNLVRISDCVGSSAVPVPNEFGLQEKSGVTLPVSENNTVYQDPYWAEFPTTDTLVVPGTTSATTYYGPVPGVYNANRPLTEPQSGQEVPKGLLVPAPYETPLQPTEFSTKSPVPTTQPTTARRIHVVHAGETLLDISRRYGITIELLRALNNMAPGETIMAYQRLFIN